MADFEDEEVINLPCGHGFHGRCIVPWLWNNKSCPNCRDQPEAHDENVNIISLNDFLRNMREIGRRQRNDLNRAKRCARSANAPPALARADELQKKWRASVTQLNREIGDTQRQLIEERRRLRSEYTKLRTMWNNESTRIAQEYRVRARPINQMLARQRQKRRVAEKNVQRFQQRMIDQFQAM